MYWALVLSPEVRHRIMSLLENAGIKVPEG